MNEFEKYSAERKTLQQAGEIPSWYTTQGYILFKRKYAYKGETVKGAFTRIAKHLAGFYTVDPEMAESKFYDLLWSGKLSPSTPVMSNTGTGRGLSVSCAGNYVSDSVAGFYESYTENAILSKLGFGTSSYLGDIRHRGATISNDRGTADGIVPVFDSCVDVMTKVSQGNNRRGAWAGYVSMGHPDFWELCGYVQKNPADTNLGWVITDSDIEKLKSKDPEWIKRWNRIIYLRLRTGKGYMFKVDTVNRSSPQAIKNSGISIKASNLCAEIALPADEDHSFSCVLSSVNLLHWDSITKEDIYWCVAFLDCVCEDLIQQAKNIKHMEKIVRFAEKARALGLGALGFHSLLQRKRVAFESFDAHMINNQIFYNLYEWAKEASTSLAEKFGEPEWCKGTGLRNATLIAIAPNMSSAILAGGISQGIEPIISNVYVQNSAGGEFNRINPELMGLLKERGVYSQELVDDIAINYRGSVQHLTCLTFDEKLVFRTAFEIDQRAILRLASARQKFIDQAQSINLFVSADEEEEYIAELHKEFLLDDRLKSLYYLRSERGVQASKGTCIACEG